VAKAKITITGTTEKPPKFNPDGTVDLVFKIPMSLQVPGGLKSLGESAYLVHVGKKSWKKVSGVVAPDSFFIIQGETKANITSKQIPFIEVVCFDIAIKEPIAKDPAEAAKDPDTKAKSVESPAAEITAEKPSKTAAPEGQEKKQKVKAKPAEPEKKTEYVPVQWYDPAEVIKINTDDIILEEVLHFNTKTIYLNGILKYINESGRYDVPVAVRPVCDGKYALVMGFKSFIIARILGFKEINAVIREATHKELTESLGIVTYDK
jgi:hypothetical protein